MSRRALKRKLWLNLALMAAAALLVALTVLEPGRESPEAPPPLSALDPDALERVVIRRPGAPEIRLERRDGRWRLVSPRELPANAGRLDDLLALAGAQSQRRYPADELDPAEIGLAVNRISVTLNETTFEFGATDAIEGWRYVRTGDEIHLTRDRFFHLLRQEPLYWADNRLLPEGSTVTAIELPDRRLHRDEAGRWHADPPLEDLSADAPVTLAQRWQEARALSVQAMDEPPGPDAPAIRVRLAGEEQPLAFRLEERERDVFLVRPELGLGYAITLSQRDDLTRLTPE